MTTVSSLSRRFFVRSSAMLFAAALLLAGFSAHAQAVGPNDLIEKISAEVIARIKADKDIQSGDFSKVSGLVDSTIMPHVNFERMTALAVGRGWREATDAQKASMVEQFRILLLRTYSGALSQFKDQRIEMKPLRALPEDKEVIVRSDILGGGEPIQMNYRLEKNGDSWKIFDLNVLGVWLVDTYRNQFKQIVNAKGMDGLIETLAEKNRQFATAEKRG
ncbi:MAG: ABC transporter substrate-binding protein [Burkholderiaceae bacterium]